MAQKTSPNITPRAASGTAALCRPVLAEPLERRLNLSSIFGPPSSPGIAVGSGPAQTIVGDFNGDGKSDIAVSNAYSSAISVYLGNGNGGFSAVPVTSNVPGGIGTIGDFNGDGILDFASGNIGNGTFGIFLGKGDGSFEPAPGQPMPLSSDNVSDMVAGHFTANGRVDLLEANEDVSTLTVLLGSGDGTFVKALSPPVKLRGFPVHLAAGDFNGDGKLDVAVALDTNTGTGAAVEVLLGNGHGGFNPAGLPIPAPGSAVDYGIESIVAADFNGDGRPDLAITASNGDVGTLSVLPNNGNGTFGKAIVSPIKFNLDATIVGEGDFTGDGKEGLAVVSADGGAYILLGNGDGTFNIAPGSPIVPALLAVGDLTGNSEPDLVTIDQNNVLSVLPNTSPQLATGLLGAAMSAELPSSALPGARVRGTATVTVTAPAGQAVHGPVSVALFASPNQSLFGATQIMPIVKRNLTLAAGASESLHLPLASFPTGLPGTYYLMAAVDAPDGSTTAAVGPWVTIPAASVVASNVTVSPATVAPGRRMSLELTLRNAGNAPASGTAELTILLSSSSLGTDGSAAASVPLRVRLKAGQSRSYQVNFRLPRGMASGSYYLVASLDVGALGDPVAVDGIAVSGMPITVRL